MARASSQKLRQQIAEEAARIVIEGGVGDYHRARIKACERLGISSKRDLPSKLEVEQAVLARQRLFSPDQATELLQFLREMALDIMRFLSEFDAHLVGSVLRGTAHRHSPIELHLFSDDSKNVAIKLIDARLPYQTIERRAGKSGRSDLTGFQFSWQNIPVEVLVFENGLRKPPMSSVDGKPMRRGSIQEVESLLLDESTAVSFN
ncbi:MAG: hypothetical protein ACWA44_03840 [Thiotrichales bacterium]